MNEIWNGSSDGSQGELVIVSRGRRVGSVKIGSLWDEKLDKARTRNANGKARTGVTVLSYDPVRKQIFTRSDKNRHSRMSGYCLVTYYNERTVSPSKTEQPEVPTAPSAHSRIIPMKDLVALRDMINEMVEGRR